MGVSKTRGRRPLGAGVGRLAGLVIVVALSACARRAPLAPSDYLQVDLNVSPTTLDPRLATDAISGRIDELVYDSLMRPDGLGNFAADLAERVEQPSATRIIFHLRRGMRFSDGHELTARDVKFSYDSTIDPATHSLKRAGLRELAAVRIVDSYTVEMVLRRPYAPAFEMAGLGIVPYGAPLDRPVATADAAIAPLGSGPFRFAAFRRDQAVVLARNPERPVPSGAARGLVLKIVPDATVRALELAEGICDLAENDSVQPDLIPYLARQPALRVERSPGVFFEYLAFNFRDSRLRDLRIRQAFAYAIDRDAIVHAMLRDTGRVASGMLPPENWAYAGDVTRYRYDLPAARRLIEAAGYGPGDPRLRFVYKTTPEGRRLAEVLQAMLKRAGIILEVRTNEWATFYADLQRGNFDLAASQLESVSPHQYYLFYDSKMVPPAGNNRGAYTDPALDRLVEAADAELDETRRRALYREVQQIAARELPYLPLWWLDTVTVANHRLSGFLPRPTGSLRSLADAAYKPGAGPFR